MMKMSARQLQADTLPQARWPSRTSRITAPLRRILLRGPSTTPRLAVSVESKPQDIPMKLFTFDPAPNPRRVNLFIAYKGIELPTEQVNLREGQQFSAEFAALSPLHCAGAAA